jgi:hypothetical protein
MMRYSDLKVEPGTGRAGRRILWGLLVLLAAAPARTAQSSPIRHRQAASQTNPDLRAWNKFLARGSTLWSRVQPPRITSAIHVLMNRGLNGADPTSNANVQYLLWRRALAPSRFDHWHPRIGTMLQALLPTISSVPSPTTSPSSSPQGIGTSPSTTPGSSATPSDPGGPATSPGAFPQTTSPSPEAIPEPGTLSIALVLIGAGICWQRRYGRPAARARDGSQDPRLPG